VLLSPFSGVPDAKRLFAWSIVSRMPLAAIGVVLVVHAREVTGSYAVAGVVAAANAVATAIGAPLLGRAVDRRGSQTAVLLASAALCGAALAGAAVLPHHAAVLPLVALAGLAGLAQPPLSACVRALWPRLIPDPARLHAAYSVEAAVLEITYIAGPPLALAVGALWGTGAGLGALAVVLGGGTIGFARLPASRAWRPDHVESGDRRAALRAPGLRTLVIVLALVGALLGAVEVAVPAVARAHDAGGATGVLLALWGIGSFAGGLAAARAGGLHGPRALALILAGMAAGHLALAAETGLALLGVLLVVAGLGIAPAFAAVFALVDGVAIPGTVTEAFAWLTTAMAIGIAIGAAGGGALADLSPAAAFGFSAAAGAAAAAVAAGRSRTLVAPVPSAACASGPTAASPSRSATAPATP
jgi:MFS family permease